MIAEDRPSRAILLALSAVAVASAKVIVFALTLRGSMDLFADPLDAATAGFAVSAVVALVVLGRT